MIYYYGIQWHLTSRCDQKCRHCYVYDSKRYAASLKDELTTEQCFSVIDQIVSFKNKFQKTLSSKEELELRVSLTGGDPLLRPDFWEILAYLKSKGGVISILGNSFHLNRRVVQRLKENGVKYYQISVDGLEKKHDLLRKKGSFKDAFRGLKILREGGIKENIMMTISPLNADNLIPLVRFAAQKKVRSFAFARAVKMGNGASLATFTPKEYREILFNYVKEKIRLAKLGLKLNLKYKDHLFKLLLWELELFDPQKASKEIYGCHMIKNHMTILPDGKILACRRFDHEIGSALTEDLFNVYSKSETQQYLDFKNYQKCYRCPLVYSCRGCPAVAAGESGSPFKPDPQCWRQ